MIVHRVYVYVVVGGVIGKAVRGRGMAVEIVITEGDYKEKVWQQVAN
jgi:hypothetical protein